MAHPTLARLLLSGLVAAQGATALKTDLHRSHATNPLWPPHARFHVVWQVLNLTLLAAIELALLWAPGAQRDGRFYLAAGLAGATLAAFWGALAFRSRYGGALYDRNGISPLQVRLWGRMFQVELNLAAVLLGSALLAILVAIYR